VREKVRERARETFKDRETEKDGADRETEKEGADRETATERERVASR